MSQAFLQSRTQWFLGLTDFQVIATNLSSIGPGDEAAVIANEPTAADGGYVPVDVYTDETASLGAYDTGTDKWKLTQQVVLFALAAGGVPYSFQNLLIWQGRGGARSNQPITAVRTSSGSPANTLVSNSHGLSDGDKVVIASSGSLPGGIATQVYYAKAVDANTIKLFTDSGLVTAVTISDAGTGTHRLCYANGTYVTRPMSVGSVTVSPGQTKPYTIDADDAL